MIIATIMIIATLFNNQFLLYKNYFMLGTTELLLLGGLALLIFGGKKVPEMMRGLGQGVKEFKKGMKDSEDIPSSDNEVKPTNEENVNNTSLDENENPNNAK